VCQGTWEEKSDSWPDGGWCYCCVFLGVLVSVSISRVPCDGPSVKHKHVCIRRLRVPCLKLCLTSVWSNGGSEAGETDEETGKLYQ
jgi:hypothetical protein